MSNSVGASSVEHLTSVNFHIYQSYEMYLKELSDILVYLQGHTAPKWLSLDLHLDLSNARVSFPLGYGPLPSETAWHKS